MRDAARPIGLVALIATLAVLLTAVGLAPAAATGTGSISGTVTSTKGEPLEAALVVAFYPSALVGYAAHASTRTDAQGRYAFSGLSAGNYGIRVWGPDGTEYLNEVWDDHDSYRTATVIPLADGEARDGIDVQMAIGGIVTGVITDTDGNPLPGAYARVQESKGPDGESRLDRGAHADEHGVFEIRGLRPGPYSASFSAGASASSEFGYVRVTYVKVEVVADSVVKLDQTLSKASIITGRVTNAQGEPIETFVADLWGIRDGRWQNLETQWSGSGGYTLRGLPSGRYAVVIWTGEDNYVDQWWGGRQSYWGGEDPNGFAPPEIELGTGVTFDADVVLDSGAWVRGRVVDEHGDPIASKKVILHLERDGGWEPFRTAYSKPDGTFEAERVPAGTYTLEFPGADNVDAEWWTDASSRSDAQRLVIAEGAVVSGIDAVLHRRSVSTSVPSLTGAAEVGATLEVVAGSDTPGASFGYEWFADGILLAGQTGAVLELGPDHLGRVITAEVTTSAPGYSPVAVATSPIGPIAPGTLSTGAPTISGAPRVRSQLVAEPGTWTDGALFTYQWFADGAAIRGATESSLVPTVGLVGKTLRVRITGSKPGYSDSWVDSLPTSPVLLESTLPLRTRDPESPPPTLPRATVPDTGTRPPPEAETTETEGSAEVTSG